MQKKIQEDIKFDLNEIKTLNPIDGEFSDLKSKKLIFQNSAKISETFSSITKPSSQKFINLIEKEIKN